jgi:hypothetical protein
MGIKLYLLSIWVPEFVLINELERTSDITNMYLDKILMKYSIPVPVVDKPLKNNLNEQRKIMAKAHNLRVHALIKALGLKNASEVGRAEMFKAGYMMGCDAQKRLGIGKSVKEAIVAARILYKVLGIDFALEENGEDTVLKVKTCALATQYSPETCKIMSAVDEGVLKGLNEKMGMKFVERMTEGAEECTACIKIKKKYSNE